MSKKALIIGSAVFLLAILVLVGWLATRGGISDENKTTKTETVQLSQLPGGWRLIEHPAYGIALEIPSAWEITVLEGGKGEASAVFLGPGVSAVVSAFKEENVEGLTPEKLLDEKRNNQAKEISKGSMRGVSYVTKLGSEHIDGFISDSYLLSLKYFLNSQILDISCSLSGPNYKTMIPTCEEILNSLQFRN